jgi:hypothetical protein
MMRIGSIGGFFLKVMWMTPGRRVHLHHAVGLAQHAQAVHVDQRLGLRRQLAEAVHDFFQQGVDLVGGLGGGQLLVEDRRRCTSPQ